MLKLTDIQKTYRVGKEDIPENKVHALRGVSLEFGNRGFVSILGPSGCGKTTLLNIVGGLDRYDSGDLIINGKSTKSYSDADWDAYRNASIGFVFQSYNLIGHLSVIENVEIALTLSGVGAEERRRRASKVLEEVGLADKFHKRPNQLSGGQMQRVAIARAMVNNPDIILADEPTGALDSKTSVQIMELLKEVAKTRLIIMVTHNGEIAEQYSTRIIRLEDGLVVSDVDNKPDVAKEAVEHSERKQRTSMNWLAAIKLSFRNLLTKKGRTLITSIAGSIGIISVALVLALSSGLSSEIMRMQATLMANYPLTVTNGTTITSMMNDRGNEQQYEEYPDSDEIIPYSRNLPRNLITDDYVAHVQNLQSQLRNNEVLYNDIIYSYSMYYNLVRYSDGVYKEISASIPSSEVESMLSSSSGISIQSMPDATFVGQYYDLLGESSRYPANKNEAFLVVNTNNTVRATLLQTLGFDVTANLKFDDIVGTEYRFISHSMFYSELNPAAGNKKFAAKTSPAELEEMYTSTDSENSIPVKIVGVARLKPDSSSILSVGLVTHKELALSLLDANNKSPIAEAQRDNYENKVDYNVLTGASFAMMGTTEETLEYNRLAALRQFGASKTPNGISIYPKDIEAKNLIKAYLDTYQTPEGAAPIEYEDLSELFAKSIMRVIDGVTYGLVAFSSISLIVSSIMIGIITYVSVIERTKEIGILRSVGARKKDIRRVFNAETLIIGFAAGVIGMLIALLLTLPINAILLRLTEIAGIAAIQWWHWFALIGGSMILTTIAGLIPSGAAAKKDPVIALRTE